MDALLDYPHLVGVKDSSGSLRSLRQLLRYAPRLRIWVGEEKLLSECLRGGGAGAISGLANVYLPRLVRLYAAFQRGEPCEGLQALIDAAADTLDAFPAPANFKHALTLIGFPHTWVRPPLTDLSEAQRHALTNAWQHIQ